MHNTYFFTQKFSCYGRPEWQVVPFGNREGIHIGTQGYDLAWLRPFEQANHPCTRDPGLYFYPERFQMGGNLLGGPEFLI
jgi:hypothetical protein